MAPDGKSMLKGESLALVPVATKARGPNAFRVQASHWVRSSGRCQSRRGRFTQRATQ